MLRPGDKVGFVCCSDGVSIGRTEHIERTKKYLEKMGLVVAESPFLYQKDSLAAGTPQERAESLHAMYRDPGIRAIFDISGGNLANQVLEYLDYDLIQSSDKELWGYSDLTVLLNAIYAKTGKASWLYQIRNLDREQGETQRKRWKEMLYTQDEKSLLPGEWRFLQGSWMEGVLIGGNIRCFLKLAGTEYFPDPGNKLLFLESYGGSEGVIASLLRQLKHMGIFKRANGLLLGTFTELDAAGGEEKIENLVRPVVPDENFPIARTRQVGHGADSRGLRIGAYFCK